MSTDYLGFALARKTSRAELLNTWLSSGGLKLYDGTRPTDADTAISTQNLLSTITLVDPAGTVEDDVFTANVDDLEPALITSTGTKTASWARALDSSSGTICDLDVGLSGSGAAIILDNLSLVEGGLVSVLSFTITEG